MTSKAEFKKVGSADQAKQERTGIPQISHAVTWVFILPQPYDNNHPVRRIATIRKSISLPTIRLGTIENHYCNSPV